MGADGMKLHALTNFGALMAGTFGLAESNRLIYHHG
jgi:hypothetical protein